MQYNRTANCSSPYTDMKQCRITLLQRDPVTVRTWSNAILPYCKQFLSLYGHEAMQYYRTANSSFPCTDKKQCNITILQTVSVPVRTCSNAKVPYCKQFHSLYGHVAMQYYRTANCSSPCTDLKQCRITLLQTVPVPVRTWSKAILPYCKQFLSLYGHEAMQYYRTANSPFPCTDMKQCNINILQTVSVPVRTCSNAILPYCKQFQSLYGHVAMQYYRTANCSSPCTDMKQCRITVLQTVHVPVRTWSNAILPYCKQFQSLYRHVAMQYYRTANCSSPCNDVKQCRITVLQTVPVIVRTYSNAILPYCKQFPSLYGYEAMQFYLTANSSRPCTDMKQCNITVVQTVPVPVRSCNNAILPFCKQFHSPYGHLAMPYYRTANSSSPCTDMCHAILPYSKQFQSLYGYVAMQYYRTAKNFSPCTIM